MGSKALSIILVFTLLASLMGPAVYAFQEPLNLEGQPLSKTPDTTTVESSRDASKLNNGKIDSSILDYSYVSQLITRYGNLYRSTYSTILGRDIGFNAAGLIVQVKDSSASKLVDSIAKKYGGLIVKEWPQINAVLIAIPADPTLLTRISMDLSTMPEVVRVYLDGLAQPAMWDTTVMLGSYYLNNTLGVNGSGVLVAVLDTGVDPFNPAVPYPDYWMDFVNGLTTPYDDHGHGTHVTGTIMGNGPSIFDTTTGMWHTVLVGPTPMFNYQRYANLTYQVDVTGYDSSTVTLEVKHLYTLLEIYTNTTIFAAGANISYWFDNNPTPILLADYSFKNQTTPVVDSFNITVPAGAKTLYVSFLLTYYGETINNITYISYWDINGWFIDYVKVYNATDPNKALLFDDIDLNTIYGPLPGYVVNATWWIRTPSNFHGIAPGAKLAAGKVCSAQGGCPYSAIMNGMEWAYNIGANVVSMSIGGRATYYDPMAMMADWLSDKGITVVIAAGNSGPGFYTVESPGISHKAITVGAATKANTTARFSSAGPSPVDYYVKPDVSAPGMAISSTVPMDLGIYAPEFPYEAWAGTSMATPHVSGLAALVKSAHPDWTPDMVKSAIVSTADWLNESPYFPGVDVYRQGAGMINPVKAVNAEILPVPANVFLGHPALTFVSSTSATVTLLNVGTQPVNVTVSEVYLYWVNDVYPRISFRNWTQQVTSPTVGQYFEIPAGGNATFTLEIDLTNTRMTTGPYGGWVVFTTNTSATFKVIFGFHLAGPVYINGTVIDIDTRKPVGGVNVYVLDPTFTTLYALQLSGADGSFSMIVPGNYSVRIAGIGNTTLFYEYYGYPTNTGNGLTYNVYLKERMPPGSVLVIFDRYATANVSSAVKAFTNAASSLGYNVAVWNPRALGTIYAPVFSGDFKAVIFLSGSYYYALSDPLDYYAVVKYALKYPGLVVLSGGDIGWFHVDDDLMTHVAHAVWVDDLYPDYYNITLLKNRLTATLLGPGNYMDYYAAPEGTPIGNITINNLTGYWPDLVLPVNNGVPAAVWGDYPDYSSIVAYYGNGSEPAKTIYFSFDFEQLPASLQYEFARRVLAFAFDSAPPVVAVPAIALKVDGDLFTVNLTGAFRDDLAIAFYLLKVYDSTGTLVYSQGSYSPVIQVSATKMGLKPGNVYVFEATAVDLVGNEVSSKIHVKYYPATSGDSMLFYENTTVSIPGIAKGATVSITATQPATIQLVSFPSTDAFKAVTGITPPPVYPYTYNIYMDLYAKESAPGTLQQVAVRITLDTRLVNMGTVKLYWWNGTAWLPVSNYAVNPVTGEVTVVVTSTTSPSISNLSGTFIVLSAIPASVGGTLAVEDTGSAPILLMVVALGVAFTGVFSVKRRQ